MAKGKIEIKMSDEEIMRCRESGESIQSIAAKNNVSFGTMQRIIKALETKKEELQLMDTVGDGTASFYTVININGDEVTIKNRDSMKNEKISQKDFVEGKTKFHKLAVAPVKVYNLKDQEPEAAPKKGKTGNAKGAEDRLRNPRLSSADRRILSAAKGINKDASEYLYDLVQQILLNGFDNEFGEKK